MKRNARVIRSKKAQSAVVGNASPQVRHRHMLKELTEKIAVLEARIVALETPRPVPPGYVPVSEFYAKVREKRRATGGESKESGR